MTVEVELEQARCDPESLLSLDGHADNLPPLGQCSKMMCWLRGAVCEKSHVNTERPDYRLIMNVDLSSAVLAGAAIQAGDTLVSESSVDLLAPVPSGQDLPQCGLASQLATRAWTQGSNRAEDAELIWKAHS